MPLFERQYLTGSFHFYHSFSVIVAQPLSFTLEDTYKKKSVNVSENFTFSNHFPDTNIAHKISTLTECNAPDLSSEKYNWHL